MPNQASAAMRAAYIATRAHTEALAAPLSAEDQLVQSMPDCSPTKWHRAHTTWFFETFLLPAAGQPAGDSRRSYLWNSYYDAVGTRHARSQRGLLSRPSLAEVEDYRREIDDRVLAVLDGADEGLLARLAPILATGLAHEQQHQELLLTDILNALSCQPFAPVYTPRAEPQPPSATATAADTFTTHGGGLVEIGHDGPGFAFDNEGPRHKVWLEPFALSDRPITIGQVRAFIADGGYRAPNVWLSAGWDFVQAHGIKAPLYATSEDGAYRQFTLHGLETPPDEAPASHLSHYEADAMARWLGGRLPTEFEWEHAARAASKETGHFTDPGANGALTPQATPVASPFGSVWQWTSSAYAPYPRFAPGAGAIGEYNGKFMANQYVLRGGSCLTSRGHIRLSYRNFWPSTTRFQMTGARIAKDRL